MIVKRYIQTTRTIRYSQIVILDDDSWRNMIDVTVSNNYKSSIVSSAANNALDLIMSVNTVICGIRFNLIGRYITE